MKKPVPMRLEAAEGLAIQALTFIAGDSERLGRFLAVTGIGPAEIRAPAASRTSWPAFWIPLSDERLAPHLPPRRLRAGGTWLKPTPRSAASLGSVRSHELLPVLPERHAEKAARCPQCGSPRLARHRELDALTIAHIDCDAFYATIEKRDDHSLMDKPVIVGGGQTRRVAACCYVARTYGIRSAMRCSKRCVAARTPWWCTPNMAKYFKAAAKCASDVCAHATRRTAVNRRGIS